MEMDTDKIDDAVLGLLWPTRSCCAIDQTRGSNVANSSVAQSAATPWRMKQHMSINPALGETTNAQTVTCDSCSSVATFWF
ncbi:hypothetical protein [Mesorhizobium amorphae]|uniref:hypothetical protein n=1 Tax=Mesorhizobium amorphae TaxID=71433 RepID=UPI001782657E|nr:hypothetical protein [Mesorhizobium amorphae]